MPMPRTACPAPLEGGLVGIRPILLAAPCAVLLVVPTASAQAPVVPESAVTAQPTGLCPGGRFTQKSHRHYVRRVFRTRVVIRKRARRRMARMRNCAKSTIAARNMFNVQRQEARIRRERRAVAAAVPSHLVAIAACESDGSPTAVSASGTYRGKYQFDYKTWQGVGGVGDPAAAPEAEQDRRAAMLYRQRGAQPWPVCGR